MTFPLVALLVASPPAPFRVAGYLPDYRAATFDPAAARGVTDLILFSAEPTADGGLDTSRMTEVPWAKFRAWKTRERVRLILCVGGWGRSMHFPAVAGTAARRRRFAEAAARHCLAERLDGVDLDWEHPKTADEERDYGELLAELRRAFDPHGLTLSATVAGWQRLPRAAFDAVDWVQVMSYDRPGKHSTFDDAKADVEKLLAAGAPAGKVVLGVPFYGRDVAKPERSRTYRELWQRHRPAADIDEVEGVYFNGPATLRKKATFARSAGLGGVMAWELGQDAPGDAALLRALMDGAKGE